MTPVASSGQAKIAVSFASLVVLFEGRLCWTRRPRSRDPWVAAMSVSIPIANAETTPAKMTLGRFFALDLLDNRFPALHGLRFVAIVSVDRVPRHVDLHGRAAHLRSTAASSASRSCIFFGMDLFFV